MLEMEARLLTAEQEAQRQAGDARAQAQRLQVGDLSADCSCLSPAAAATVRMCPDSGPSGIMQ